ncbi:MAG: DUF5668 domain-containing protein [Anaerolineae bacterium]
MSAIAPTPSHHQRSWFWPLILIGVGLIWLLRNLEIISSANILVLLRLWPLLLIAAGINVLVAHRNPQWGLWIGAGTVVIAVAIMVVAPNFGIGKLETTTDQYAEPLGAATSADVTLELGAGTTVVQALADSNQLITADITHVDEVYFSASGSTSKSVRLSNNTTSTSFFVTDWASDFSVLRWNIGLTTAIPLSLKINGGVGDSTFDLSGVKLTGLNFRSGVGNSRLLLPAAEESYSVTADGGVGDTEIVLRSGAALNLQITGGVGSFDLVVPPDVALRLEVTSDLGKVSVPNTYVRVSGDGDHDGIWTTPNFDTATHKVYVSFKGGLGSLTVH